MATAQEIIDGISTYDDATLHEFSGDERTTVATAAQEELDRRARPEDSVDLTPEDFKPAELSSPEVPLEESRKDDTTVLATDAVEWNQETGEYKVVPAGK
jgi:hypothetical protein